MIGISVAISSHLVARCSEPTAETTGQEKIFVAFGDFRGWRATGFSARIQVFFTYDSLC